MGDCIDREVAMSQQDKEIETEATLQAHYIQWGLIMGILDPCGHQRGYQHIVAIYIGYLTSRVHFRNKDFSEIDYCQGIRDWYQLALCATRNGSTEHFV